MDEGLSAGDRGEIAALVDRGIALGSSRLVTFGVGVCLGTDRLPASVGRLAPARIGIRDLLGVLPGDALIGIGVLVYGLLGRALLGLAKPFAALAFGGQANEEAAAEALAHGWARR